MNMNINKFYSLSAELQNLANADMAIVVAELLEGEARDFQDNGLEIVRPLEGVQQSTFDEALHTAEEAESRESRESAFDALARISKGHPYCSAVRLKEALTLTEVSKGPDLFTAVTRLLRANDRARVGEHMDWSDIEDASQVAIKAACRHLGFEWRDEYKEQSDAILDAIERSHDGLSSRLGLTVVEHAGPTLGTAINAGGAELQVWYLLSRGMRQEEIVAKAQQA